MTNTKYDIKSIEESSLYWAFGSLTFFTLILIFKADDKRKKFLHMFKEKIFLLSAFISLIFSGYIFSLPHSPEVNRLKKATEQGLVAFFIAIFAYLDLRVTPFWLIWLISYYFRF